VSTYHRAKKSLGQNFLVDPGQQRRIIAALQPEAGDTVIEIGPGQGALTRHLVGTVARLVLIELDDALAAALSAAFADAPGVDVVHGDVLAVDLAELVPAIHEAKVVGNIPYNITTPIMFRLLERRFRPRRIVLMVQREVADRVVAAAGTPEYGALSVGVRSVARVERLFHVGRRSFRPVPRVDSSVLLIEPFSPPPLREDEEADVRELTRVAFSWRRKQLQKILRAAPHYALSADQVRTVEDATGIDLGQRPERLEPEQFHQLARAIRTAAPA
jgi:16S rRNA (adenine1518-N6/adenine1519-N6)-dimethyltransferase